MEPQILGFMHIAQMARGEPCSPSFSYPSIAALDIVIVAYRSEAHLPRLLEDLVLMGKLHFRLLMTDHTGSSRTLSASWNSLGRSGTAPFIAFLNPDIALSPGWDEALRGALEAHPGVGAVLPDPAGSSPSTIPKPSRERMAELAREFSPRSQIDIFRESTPFFAFMLRRKDWEALGGFDERLRLWGQDSDLQRRLQKRLGLSTARVLRCPVWHYGSSSILEAIDHHELDTQAEIAHCGRVAADLSMGRLQDWDLLAEAERSEIRENPEYSKIPRPSSILTP